MIGDAIGVVEIKSFVYAVEVLDTILKASNVSYLNSEKNLGGKLVTIIVQGNVSDVKQAIETVNNKFHNSSYLKSAILITNPHTEILKFIIPKQAGDI